MPGGAALTGPTVTLHILIRKPGKAKPPLGFCLPASPLCIC
ncbi:hypothetical protein ENTCAN_08415 [Enterobacter cancerogenus ATCC 35316]|nr:hypothetical protein ENTCAN_08415 [Enterobacter cancerogenus ATCC 35316]